MEIDYESTAKCRRRCFLAVSCFMRHASLPRWSTAPGECLIDYYKWNRRLISCINSLLQLVLSHPMAIFLSAVSYLVFSILLPNSFLLYLLTKLFPHWPRHQLYVLRDFLSSPRAIYSALRMGRDELRTITSISTLDTTLKLEAKKIWVYFGDNDRWVPENSAKKVFQVLRESGGARTKAEVVRRIGNSRFHANGDCGQNESEWKDHVAGEVVFGTGIPHDYCISESPTFWHPTTIT